METLDARKLHRRSHELQPHVASDHRGKVATERLIKS